LAALLCSTPPDMHPPALRDTLDELGYPTHVGHGFMTVHDNNDKALIAKVPRTRNCLYIVH
jgi:hypothetical protein